MFNKIIYDLSIYIINKILYNYKFNLYYNNKNNILNNKLLNNNELSNNSLCKFCLKYNNSILINNYCFNCFNNLFPSM